MTTNEDRDRLFGVVALELGFILFAKTVTGIDKAGQNIPNVERYAMRPQHY